MKAAALAFRFRVAIFLLLYLAWLSTALGGYRSRRQ